jgi:hypothetical protein
VAAPGPVEAADTVRGAQAPPPAVHDAVPVVVRGAPAAGSKLVAAELAEPLHAVAPDAQSTDAAEVDTADGPLTAARCPGNLTPTPEDANESLPALQPPCSTVHSPLPAEDLTRPLSTAASDPLAPERTTPEHDTDPAAQVTEPDASDTLSNPPATDGCTTALMLRSAVVAVGSVGSVGSVCRVGSVKRVAEFDRAPQPPPVAVQSEEPVDVFATATLALPVTGSTLTSPEPVDDVFELPLPAHPVCPCSQVTELDAPLDPAVSPVPVSVSVPVPNRPPPVVSGVAPGVVPGLLACEPDCDWQPPPVTVQVA